MGRMFGRDGMRGIAVTELTCELALQIGRAAAVVLAAHNTEKTKILIGMDTRSSSDSIAAALCAGICSAGADAELIGEVPTPALAWLTKESGANGGRHLHDRDDVGVCQRAHDLGDVAARGKRPGRAMRDALAAQRATCRLDVQAVLRGCTEMNCKLILTSPCFELWVAMHFEEYRKVDMLEYVREYVYEVYYIHTDSS